MKQNTRIIYALPMLIFALCASRANATPVHMYANGISAHNIAVIQRSIITTAMGAFAESAAGAINTQHTPTIAHAQKADTSVYGHPTMYGEYGDDGSVFSTRGRSGGDVTSHPSLSNAWINWQHYNQDARFKDMVDADSDFDNIIIGVSGTDTQFDHGIAKWGVYGGYINGTQDNKVIEIDENAGYFGLYGGYDFGDLDIAASVNSGALTNHVHHNFGHDEYVNLWTGAAINTQHNIELDRTFSLQPGIYAGYTWIRSADYTSASGEHIANQNFNMFELTPGLRAIKSLGDGWFGNLSARYVFNFVGGGDATVNSIGIDALDLGNYSEYGIGFEKSVDAFYLSANLNRRDGRISGWFGGINLKYLF